MSDNASIDQFTRLFDLAHDPEAAAIAALSQEERDELERIRETLQFVDMHWRISPETHSRIQKLFFQELAAEQPNHPWLQLRPITTLGELIETSIDDRPPISDESYFKLKEDTTLLSQIVDPSQRTNFIARVVHRTKLPQADIRGFTLWLNRVMADLVPGANPQHIPAFTRRQRPSHNSEH